jgi:hypothetical protein
MPILLSTRCTIDVPLILFHGGGDHIVARRRIGRSPYDRHGVEVATSAEDAELPKNRC